MYIFYVIPTWHSIPTDTLSAFGLQRYKLFPERPKQ